MVKSTFAQARIDNLIFELSIQIDPPYYIPGLYHVEAGYLTSQ